MNSSIPVEFKVADKQWELNKIFDLNYRTFVEEIRQHSPNPDRILVDKFHRENTYVICIQNKELLGMIAFRDKRPFSLDFKIKDLDAYLPAGCSICEIRLLAIEKKKRYSRILQGLIKVLADHALSLGHNLAIISGTLRQTKLYRHLGFVPFGPIVGSPKARFQPMYLTLDAFVELEMRSRVFSKEMLTLKYR